MKTVTRNSRTARTFAPALLGALGLFACAAPVEKTGVTSQADSTYGACITRSVLIDGGTSVLAGWPSELMVIWEAYGSFGGDGANVSSGIVCNFNDGSVPISITGT